MYPNHDLFTLVLHNDFLCFLVSFLSFFFKVQSKIGVHIIHRCALYTGKYGNKFLHSLLCSRSGQIHAMLLVPMWLLQTDIHSLPIVFHNFT